MTVRQAKVGELAAAGELVGAAYVQDGLLLADDPYRSQLQDAANRALDSVVLVAVEDDVVLGTVTWCPLTSSHREVARAGEGELRGLGVAHEARGRGVGELLVRACLERARVEGLTFVALLTSPKMASAHRIYERLGFVRDPERDWCPVPDFQLLAYRLDLRRS